MERSVERSIRGRSRLTAARSFRPRPLQSLLAAAVLGVACLAPHGVTVAGSGADGPRSFNHFCSKWMRKLESREKRNLSLVSFVRRGQWVIGEFVGYSRKAKKCKATPTGNASNPFVGRLVYDEIYYQKAGSTTKEARGSEARPAARTEVTEIFRFDGDDWVY